MSAPVRRRRRRLFGGATGVATLFAGLVVCGVASAYWTATGSGVASAHTATLDAPTAVTASVSGTSVDVGFTGVTAPVGAVDGYVVTRWSDGTPGEACGTDPADPGTWLPAATTTCTDSGLSGGTYTYTVTARFRTWTATSTPSAAVTVAADTTAPTITVSVLSGDAAMTGTTVYWRSQVAGSFVLRATVTDSGSGPASAEFPARNGQLSHAAELVAHQNGALPTRTYDSSPFTWNNNAGNSGGPYTVTGRDAAGNQVSTNVTFVRDQSSPGGGALSVNGQAASSGGTTSDSTSGSWNGSSVTHYSTDTGSGLASSVLTREDGSFVDGDCTSFGAPTVVTGVAASNLPSGCYRYTLTGTDRVGNESVLRTTVRVDRTAPTFGPVTAIPGNGDRAWFDNATNTLYYANSPAGDLRLAATLTDHASGPASVNFPQANSGNCNWWGGGTCFTHANQTVTNGTGSLPSLVYTSNAYTWTNNADHPTAVGTRTLTGTDAFGNSSTLVYTAENDESAPTGGALRVNGTNANGGGTFSSTSDGTWEIDLRTDWTDTGSGIDTSTLVRESASLSGTTCGTFGGAETITGTPEQSDLPTNRCYRYTLTGTDNLGHTSSVRTTVRSYPPGPYVVSMTLNNGTTAGRMNEGDTIVIQFSEQMDVSTFCSTWTNSNQNQQITANNAVFVRLTNGNAADDYVEVRTSNAYCGGSFNLGRITLGGTGHITNNPWTDFGGAASGPASTIHWNAATRTMTVTLGRGSVGPGTPSNDVGDYVATYDPHTAIRGTASATVPVRGPYLTESDEHF